MYHVVAENKVAEQHISRKYSNCNSFAFTIDLLNVRISKVAITQLFDMQQVQNLTM